VRSFVPDKSAWLSEKKTGDGKRFEKKPRRCKNSGAGPSRWRCSQATWIGVREATMSAPAPDHNNTKTPVVEQSNQFTKILTTAASAYRAYMHPALCYRVLGETNAQ